MGQIQKIQISAFITAALVFSAAFSYGGEYDKEIKHQREIIAQDATNLDAAYTLGNFLSWDGYYQEAIGVYEGILKREPKYTDAEIAIGRVYAWMGDQEKAKALFLDILKRYPGKQEAYQGLGSLALWANDYAASISYFNKALNLNSKDTVSLKGIGRAYLGKGDRRRAEEYFTQAQILEIRQMPMTYWAARALIAAAFLGCIFYLFRLWERRKKERVLKLELQLLRTSLDLYRQHTGKYPLALENLRSASWKPDGKNQEKPYLNGSIRQEDKGLLVDVFGKRFWYNPDTGVLRSGTPGYEDW